MKKMEFVYTQNTQQLHKEERSIAWRHNYRVCTRFFRVKADVERETRATGEVQKTAAPCLPGKHEKVAPVLQATYETIAFFFF